MTASAFGLLTVDLGAIAENWRRLVAEVDPRCRVGAVVKADAYGLGAVRVTRRLLDTGCRRFFVATPMEGVGLAEAIADRRVPGGARSAEIAVLDGVDAHCIDDFLRHDLIPVLNEPGQVKLWQAQGNGRPAILQFDSGMSRLGLSAGELAALIADGTIESLAVDTVMSHLGCADIRAHPMNATQRASFEAMVAMLPETVRLRATPSLSASSGIFLGADFHYGLVRPGAALWGLNPIPDQPNPMRQVVGLKAKIIQVLEIDPGRGVGYGATYVAPAPRRIATIGIGYADGYPRAAGNRATVYIGATPVPVIGRISMDLMTLDVTGVAPELAKPGIFVDVLGTQYGADDLARDSDTIGYEILTRFSRRLHRSYLS